MMESIEGLRAGILTELRAAVREGLYQPDSQRIALKILLKESGLEVKELWDVLENLAKTLEGALPLEEEKLRAIQENRLTAVEDCMSREQALTMQLRGLDRRREEILAREGLKGASLRSIVAGLPADRQEEASRLAGRLEKAVHSFQLINDEAMKLVQLHLHKIEQTQQKQETAKKGDGNTQRRAKAGTTDCLA